MRQFYEPTRIEVFETAQEFVETFDLGKKDFVIASEAIYEKYFRKMNLNVYVVYKGKYGKSEPTDLMMNALLQDFRRTSCTRIIAIGGGAVIDMAKLLVLDTTAFAEQIFSKDMEYVKKRELIVVPTTCGAGSEVSSVTIAEFVKEKTKLGLAVDALYPDYAALIPELLRELPYEYFATSAIDALIHAIESYVSPKASIYTEVFSEKAIRLILEGFRGMAKNGKAYRMECLKEFLVASNLAGVAFANAGTGSVHAMSYPLSGRYHVTHGEANYQLLTGVFLAYNQIAPEGKIKKLNGILAECLACQEQEVYQELEALLDQIVKRKSLREYGMLVSEVEAFVEQVLETQKRLLNQSYVYFTKEQMVEIYTTLY